MSSRLAMNASGGSFAFGAFDILLVISSARRKGSGFG